MLVTIILKILAEDGGPNLNDAIPEMKIVYEFDHEWKVAVFYEWNVNGSQAIRRSIGMNVLFWLGQFS